MFSNLSSLESKSLITFFIDHLKEIERNNLGCELQVEDVNKVDNLLELFSYKKELTILAEKFFKNFFLVIREIPYILEPELILSKLETVLAIYSNFYQLVLVEAEHLSDFVEEYGLTLENRLMAIQAEQDSFKQHQDKYCQESFTLIRDEYGLKLVLTVQDTPSPLIGMTDLLNYQINQIAEINRSIYEAIEDAMEKHQLTKIIIETEPKPSQQTVNAFIDQVNKDKVSLVNCDDKELILDIAADLASNLLYRVYWDAKA